MLPGRTALNGGAVEIEVRPADTEKEVEALVALDEKIFSPGDRFEDGKIWKEYAAFWIVADGKVVGSTALGLNVRFSADLEVDEPELGCLYVASTGILPESQRKGIGTFVKRWQIEWAKSKGFTCISTNCRKGNAGSLRLNAKFGFEVVGETPHYYKDPDEAVVELRLNL